VSVTQVAYTLASWHKAGKVELQRVEPHSPGMTRTRIVGVRFLASPTTPSAAGRMGALRRADTRATAGTYSEPIPVRLPHDVAQEPPPPPTPTGILPTPNLATYAEARKLSQANPMLRAEPTPSEASDILAEAVRLYWWVRAGRR